MNSQDIAIPQLPSRSIEKTLAFYTRLGFKGKAFPGHDYEIVELGGLEIYFFLHEILRPEESAFSCYLRVQDVRAMYDSGSRRRVTSCSGSPRDGLRRR